MFHIVMLSAMLAAADAAPVPGETWSYRLLETPTLVYGVDESDDAPVIFKCKLRKGFANIQTEVVAPPPTPSAADWSGVVKLRSGSVSGSVKAKVTASEMTGGEWAEADIPLGAPILQAFRGSGRLTVLNDNAAVYDAKSGAERAAIATFFKVCAGGPAPKR